MHNKTKHKLILKPMTNELNETKSRCKKTRKMKGGVFNFLKKTAPVAGPISPSTEPTTTTASTIVKTSAVVGVITTLATIASESLTNPVTLTAITGILSTSVALASGGGAAVLFIVAAAAWLIIKKKKKAYKGLMLVMDELYLVLQKLSGILDVSMHIAKTYGFPIDTRDVNIALNSIMVKFDELLEPTDFTQIKSDLSNFRRVKQEFNGQAAAVANNLEQEEESQDNIPPSDPPKLSLFTRINNQRKQITFSAPKFVEELNEAVAYLALYFAALAASFSITYTTVVVQLIVNGKTEDLKSLQAKMLEANQFHSMLEGALVYPVLQSRKTYDTCKLKNLKDSSCDTTFVTASNNALSYMKSKLDATDSAVGSELYKKMTNLKTVVDASATISSVDAATKFAEDVKKARDNDANASAAPLIVKPEPNSVITAPATTNPVITAPNPAITAPNPVITEPNPAITVSPATTAITEPNPATTNPAITATTGQPPLSPINKPDPIVK